MPGYPIRTPWDHSSVDSSPRPIAASHVLHRLLVPRHPPSALDNLTYKNTTQHPPPQRINVNESTYQRINESTVTTVQCRKDARVHYAHLNTQPTHTHHPTPTPHPVTGSSRSAGPGMPGTERNTPTIARTHRHTHRHTRTGCSLRTSTGCSPPPPAAPPHRSTPTRARTRGSTRHRPAVAGHDSASVSANSGTIGTAISASTSTPPSGAAGPGPPFSDPGSD